MKENNEYFKNLVRDAQIGKLKLPAFQRNWIWKPQQVIRLFDSLRKKYPIGSFLTLEASDEINLSPKSFRGAEGSDLPLTHYVLDGQQRITAGISLYYGKGTSHYFVDLDLLWKEVVDEHIDLGDKKAVEAFASHIDYETKYIKRNVLSQQPLSYLGRGWLWTPCLADFTEFSAAKRQYLLAHPDQEDFLELLIWPHFQIGPEPSVPVTVLEADMQLEVVTRIFETLNTSGQKLTPVDVVVALLFPRGVNLRTEIESIKEETIYYPKIEGEGEVLLQTIALLDGKSPQGTTLPKNITAENYRQHKEDAISCLERAGEFLSERFGTGIQESIKYVPYPAMVPPLGIALRAIETKYAESNENRANYYKQLEKWFVGSVLSGEYAESQPRTQRVDVRRLIEWIEVGDPVDPSWVSNIRVGTLAETKPDSAIGKLLSCIVSSRQPKDPLTLEPVGGNGGEIIAAQSHHIFPKAFCEDHIPQWKAQKGECDLAVNVMPLSKETNRHWHKMNPSDQINDVVNQERGNVAEVYAPFFVDEECIEVMKKPAKTKDDFNKFVSLRGSLFQHYIVDRWGFQAQNVPVVDDDEADPTEELT